MPISLHVHWKKFFLDHSDATVKRGGAAAAREEVVHEGETGELEGDAAEHERDATAAEQGGDAAAATDEELPDISVVPSEGKE